MNNVIRQLNQDIVRLISAGEVIEAPASVIKELVENSIDAGADSITVEIKDGGKTYMRVTDNGEGIGEQFVEEAFRKHSTSKIYTLDDFNNINTNGFRGEALSSVIAVSQTTMTTKTKEQNYAINITFKDEKIIEKMKVGATDGTSVVVKDLFENMPARKKFLKSSKAEAMRITSYLIRYALAHPELKIKYINNSKQIFQTFGTNDLIQVSKEIFSEDYYNKAISLDEEINEEIKIQGLIGKNSLMYSSRKMQYIFVNSRIVHAEALQRYVEEAYKKYIPSGNFPMFFLNIIVNPQMVDVNIHPNKLEVKFEKEKEIFSKIRDTISHILDSSVMIPSVSLSMDESDESIFKNTVNSYLKSKENSDTVKSSNYDTAAGSSKYYFKEINTKIPIQKIEKDQEFVYSIKKPLHDHTVKEDTIVKSPTFFIPKQSNYEKDEPRTKDPYFVDLTLLKYAGRVFDTYIILHDESHMYMIDQHAAHERVLYEKYMADFKNQCLSTQGLLMPQNIPIPPDLTNYSDKIINLIDQFGFDCELFGDNIILIRSIPTYFTQKQSQLFVQRVFDTFLQEDVETYDDVLINKIATKACKAAIKGLDTTVKDEEVEKLLYDLEHCENKYACPHGRPTITRLTKYEIEKFFKRIL